MKKFLKTLVLLFLLCVVLLALPPVPPSTDHTISTAASTMAITSGLKRGFFGCKKINSSSGFL